MTLKGVERERGLRYYHLNRDVHGFNDPQHGVSGFRLQRFLEIEKNESRIIQRVNSPIECVKI